MFVPIFYFDTQYNTSILFVPQIFIFSIVQRGSEGGNIGGKRFVETRTFEIVYNLCKNLYIYGKFFLHLWIVFIALLEKKFLLHLWKVFITFVEKNFYYICGFFLLHLWISFLLHLWKVFITFVKFVTFVARICYICGSYYICGICYICDLNSTLIIVWCC